MGLDQTVKGGRPFVPVTDAVHAKIGAAGVHVTETWAPPHKTIFNFSDTLLPTVNATGVGYGNIKLYDFEPGLIQLLGVISGSNPIALSTCSVRVPFAEVR